MPAGTKTWCLNAMPGTGDARKTMKSYSEKRNLEAIAAAYDRLAETRNECA
jgi:hypothetical protein